MRRHGFTLIELLVVIAIIAILAAILFPVFARAREKARQTSCLSNVKQLILGALQYAQDYDELFPPCYEVEIAGYDDGLSQGGFTTDSSILPYVKNAQIFLCPSCRPHRVCNGWDIAGITSTTDYAWNCIALWGVFNHLGTQLDSARCGIITELRDPGNEYAYWPWLVAKSDGHFLHNGGQHVGFMDGHAKWFSKQTFDSGFNSSGYLL